MCQSSKRAPGDEGSASPHENTPRASTRVGLELTATSATLSEKGPLRSLNADACLADDALKFYAVGDGVGSSQDSVRASAFAVTAARDLYVQALQAVPSPADVNLAALIDEVFGRYKAEFAGARRMPATTLTVLTITGSSLRYASVGDSPIFLVEEDRVSLLTRQHTVVDSHQIYTSFSEMKSRPGSHVLSNVLSAVPPEAVTYSDIQLGGDCRLILCSDGLMELYDQAELTELSAARTPLGEAPEIISARGLRTNPPDNFTVVIVDVATGGPPRA